MNVLTDSERIVHAHSDKSVAHLCGSVGDDNMRNFTRTILAALAVLMLAVGGVAAHGSDGTASDQDPVPENASADERGTWMEQHMTEHMGADSAAQMQDRMGMSYEQMGSVMKGMMDDEGMDNMMNENGSGTGCH